MTAEGRIILVNHALLRNESIELQDIDGHPDKPESGTNDCIDATVGSFANAVEMVGYTCGTGDSNILNNRVSDLPKQFIIIKDPKILITENQLRDKETSTPGLFIDP
jgi:hypothetical protein